MEVMAEANEQPALLNQDVDVKKTRRTKTAARPRRTTASKTGARRAKKQTTDDETTSADTNSHFAVLEGQDSGPSQNVEDAPEMVSTQPLGTVEPPPSANDHKSTAMSEPLEPSVSTVPPHVRFQETPPAVEVPRYDPVFGEGL